jgi:hypothetical protein
VVGAVDGAKKAVPIDTAKEIDSIINHAVAGLDAQNSVASQITARSKEESWIRLYTGTAAGPVNESARPAYAELRTVGIDSVLEVAITQIGFESCGPEWLRNQSGGCDDNTEKKRVDLFMSAQARLVRVNDGTEIYTQHFRYQSPRREIARWVANDGQLLAKEFELAYHELAERVHDEMLLVTQLPTLSHFAQSTNPESPDDGVCWLAPVYPEIKPIEVSDMLVILYDNIFHEKPQDVCPASGLYFTVIDSLRPKLRWGAFPRELDHRRLDPSTLQKVGNVTYDLKIWEAESCERSRLVYERTGLLTPVHQIEESLEPASRYFWSVRAKYTLDGWMMATRWAHFDPHTCYPNDITDWQYHRFITPR